MLDCIVHALNIKELKTKSFSFTHSIKSRVYVYDLCWYCERGCQHLCLRCV